MGHDHVKDQGAGESAFALKHSLLFFLQATIKGVIHMIGLKRVLPFAALLLSTSFAAQAGMTTYVFGSVTGIQYAGGDGLPTITGVLVNDTASTTLVLSGFSDRCANLVLAMIRNSGTYKLTVVTDTETSALGGTSTLFSWCRLDLGP